MAASGSRTAKVELKTSAAGMDRGLSDARRKLRSFEREEAKAARGAARAKAKAAKEAEKARSRASKGAAGAIGAGGGLVAGLGAAAGFDIAGGIGGMVSEVADVEKELTRLSIDAGMSSNQMAAFRANLMDVSEATGQSRLELAKGAHAYQTITGDAKGAMQSIRLFGEVANGSGATMEDIARTAASMQRNLGIDPKDFRKGFDVFMTMGHEGAVELRDFSEQMSGLAPQFKDFGTKMPADKLAEMAASAQVIQANFGDASEMATGFRSLMTAVTKKQDKLAGYGINVFQTDPKTKKLIKRDFIDIVGDILKNKKLDDKILPKLLGRDEAVRALGAFRDHWSDILALQAKAEGSDQVRIDNQKYLESSTGRIAMAWNKVKDAIANALTPERVEKFASAIEHAAKFLGDAIGTLDKLMNGPDEKAAAGNMASDFVEAANTGDEKDHARVVQEAIDAFDPTKEAELTDMYGPAGAYGTHSIKAYREGAKRFLDSEGIDTSGWADLGNERGRFNRSGVSAALGSGQLDPTKLAKQIGMALAQALRESPPVVKADSTAIAKVGANAHIHTTRPGGRK